MIFNPSCGLQASLEEFEDTYDAICLAYLPPLVPSEAVSTLAIVDTDMITDDLKFNESYDEICGFPFQLDNNCDMDFDESYDEVSATFDAKLGCSTQLEPADDSPCDSGFELGQWFDEEFAAVDEHYTIYDRELARKASIILFEIIRNESYSRREEIEMILAINCDLINELKLYITSKKQLLSRNIGHSSISIINDLPKCMATGLQRFSAEPSGDCFTNSLSILLFGSAAMVPVIKLLTLNALFVQESMVSDYISRTAMECPVEWICHYIFKISLFKASQLTFGFSSLDLYCDEVTVQLTSFALSKSIMIVRSFKDVPELMQDANLRRFCLKLSESRGSGKIQHVAASNVTLQEEDKLFVYFTGNHYDPLARKSLGLVVSAPVSILRI